jgi:hypothetical protein
MFNPGINEIISNKWNLETALNLIIRDIETMRRFPAVISMNLLKYYFDQEEQSCGNIQIR